MAVTYITSGLARAVDIFTPLIVPWPTSNLLVNDVGLLIIENESLGGFVPEDTIPTIADPAWQLAATSTNDPSEDGVRVTIFMCRATSTSMPSVSVTFPVSGDHLLARIYTFRGVSTTGNPPISTSATSVKDIGSNTWTAPAITTTVANSLVLCVVGRNTDFASGQFTVGTNANLTGRTIINQIGTTINTGGGFALISGTKVIPGDTGISTGTVLNNALNASITFAFLEPSGSVTYTIDAVTTAFTVTSTTTSLEYTYSLVSTVGNYNVVTNNTSLEFVFSLSLDAVAYNVDTTTNVTLLKNQILNLLTSSFGANGFNIDLFKNQILNLLTSSFGANGFNIGLLKNQILNLLTSSFGVNGFNINLLKGQIFNLLTSSFGVNTLNTALIFSRILTVIQGIFNINFVNANLYLYLYLNAVLRTFLIGSVSLILSKNYSIDVLVQAYILTPIITNVSRLYQLNALLNTYSIVGVLVNLSTVVTHVIQSITAAFNINYKATELFKVYPVNLTAQSFILNGIASGIIRRYDINATTRAYLINDSGLDYFSDRNIIILPLDLTTKLQSNGDFFWYRTTNTIPVVKPLLTNRNQWILGRATHMGRRGL